jgi:hypothetical protein
MGFEPTIAVLEDVDRIQFPERCILSEEQEHG